MKYALIGCGRIAVNHMKAAINNKLEIVAVCDVLPEKMEALLAKYDLQKDTSIKRYTDYKQMLAENDITLASIATESGIHAEIALYCIDHGVNVIIEKPMAMSMDDAEEIVRRSEEKHVKVAACHQNRFNVAIQQMRKALEAGRFGKISHGSIHVRWNRDHGYYDQATWRGTWAQDGGCLMNQGIHGIDVFRYLMGPLKSLSAITKTLTRPVEVEDSAAAIVEFANGAIGTIEGSTTCFPGYPRRIEICGDKGSVVMEEDSILRWDLPIPCRIPVGKNAQNVASSDPGAIACSGHVTQIQNLVNAVLHGAPLMADVSTGRPPLEVILGIYESGKTGNPCLF